jgi:hypothetical protein
MPTPMTPVQLLPPPGMEGRSCSPKATDLRLRNARANAVRIRRQAARTAAAAAVAVAAARVGARRPAVRARTPPMWPRARTLRAVRTRRKDHSAASAPTEHWATGCPRHRRRRHRRGRKMRLRLLRPWPQNHSPDAWEHCGCPRYRRTACAAAEAVVWPLFQTRAGVALPSGLAARADARLVGSSGWPGRGRLACEEEQAPRGVPVPSVAALAVRVGRPLCRVVFSRSWVLFEAGRCNAAAAVCEEARRRRQQRAKEEGRDRGAEPKPTQQLHSNGANKRNTPHPQYTMLMSLAVVTNRRPKRVVLDLVVVRRALRPPCLRLPLLLFSQQQRSGRHRSAAQQQAPPGQTAPGRRERQARKKTREERGRGERAGLGVGPLWPQGFEANKRQGPRGKRLIPPLPRWGSGQRREKTNRGRNEAMQLIPSHTHAHVPPRSSSFVVSFGGVCLFPAAVG